MLWQNVLQCSDVRASSFIAFWWAGGRLIDDHLSRQSAPLYCWLLQYAPFFYILCVQIALFAKTMFACTSKKVSHICNHSFALLGCFELFWLEQKGNWRSAVVKTLAEKGAGGKQKKGAGGKQWQRVWCRAATIFYSSCQYCIVKQCVPQCCSIERLVWLTTIDAHNVYTRVNQSEQLSTECNII